MDQKWAEIEFWFLQKADTPRDQLDVMNAYEASHRALQTAGA